MKIKRRLSKWLTLIMILAGSMSAIFVLTRVGERRSPPSSAGLVLASPPTPPPLKAASSTPTVPADAVQATRDDVPGAPKPSPAAADADSDPILARLTFGSQWAVPPPATPSLAAFARWTDRYLAAAPASQAGLVREGVALAQTRRADFAELIRNHPEEALATTVPLAVRSQLPASVNAVLEERVSGRGDLHMIATTARIGEAAPDEPTFRTAVVNGHYYRAHVYGRREHQTTKVDISLAGVALDGQLAVSESPVRLLETGEISSTTHPVSAACPVLSIQGTTPAAQGTPASTNGLTPPGNICGSAIEVGGTVEVPCCLTHVATTESALIKAEDTLGPYSGSLSAKAFAEAASTGTTTTQTTGALYPTSWTEGPKAVMVILADFSDLPGTPIDAYRNVVVTPAEVLNFFYNPDVSSSYYYGSGDLNSYFSTCSYGKTSLVVGAGDIAVVRMPQTAAYYAAGGDGQGNTYQMHADAEAAATALGFNVPLYDRIVLIFSNLNEIPGSVITYGGRGEVAGKDVWINGYLSGLEHELGHTYGLQHANLYQTTDGTVTGTGSSIEYGDPTDGMSASINGDQYNMWSRNLLAWMPDSAVTNVTTSGTYRVYRFDSQNPSSAGAWALKIPGTVVGDNVHDYWIGMRESIPKNADSNLYNSAYILWGYHYSRQSDLLNMNPQAGEGAADAALQVGKTFSENGITIKPLAVGGNDPEQFMDVQITVPSIANTSTFFTGETALSGGVYYLTFAGGNYFGYYSFLTDPAYIYHFDLGYEYVFDANDGKSGVYLYDFASSDFFYTSPTFPFPYLYDFGLNSVVYYYPDATNPGHYTSNPRYFFDYATSTIVTK